MIEKTELFIIISVLWTVGVSLIAYIVKFKDKKDDIINKSLVEIKGLLNNITVTVETLKTDLRHNIEDTREITKDVRKNTDVTAKHGINISNLNNYRQTNEKNMTSVNKKLATMERRLSNLERTNNIKKE